MVSTDSLRSVLENRFKEVESYLRKLSEVQLEMLQPETAEKFNIMIGELHSIDEYLHYLDERNKFEDAQIRGVEPSELDIIEARMNTFKLWWAKLNQEIISGYSKISDRNERAGRTNIDRGLSVQQIYVFIDNAHNELKLIEAKVKESELLDAPVKIVKDGELD
jgi:hypothetical protein